MEPAIQFCFATRKNHAQTDSEEVHSFSADVDVFMICPGCQLKAEFTYHKDVKRPTVLDTEISMICPICGGKMVKLVNPEYKERYDLERRVEDLNRFMACLPQVNEQNRKAVEKLSQNRGIINA